MRLLIALLLPLAVLACTTGADAPTAASTPDAAAVRSAREGLGPPMVTLADALLAAAAATDRARHDVPRGAEAVAAAAGLPPALDALRAAALAADDAARPLAGEGRIGRSADVVRSAAALAVQAADEGGAQAAALQRLSEFDARMDAVVAAWDAPGSRAERRAELAALTGELEAVAAEAAAEPAVPPDCPALRDARVRWAQLLAERTRALTASVMAGSGASFDEQRAAFDADPYGEDRLAADAADRACWGRESALARAAAGIRGEVETLEVLLQR